jgi:hypothetical protein
MESARVSAARCRLRAGNGAEALASFRRHPPPAHPRRACCYRSYALCPGSHDRSRRHRPPDPEVPRFPRTPSWRRWCQSSERRPCGPPRPPTPQASRCALASQVVGKTQKPCLGRPPPPTAVLPATDVHSAARGCRPPNPTRPPPRHRATRSPARSRRDSQGASGRRGPERRSLEAFHLGPYRSAPPPCCCVPCPSAASLRAIAVNLPLLISCLTVVWSPCISLSSCRPCF